ncbi:extracellular solute-binding protein [Muricoccus pecuniae]|uniref:Putative spermidine/putrescine transport system substrate-binding protein n=1 Tax=Muricoccus pecuniae TaxID=693023 RepID=A0A840Y6G5_9PROT|nr:extracellular solute-binding protein [Roseomonas pecuniae]MBB5696325.1 putative spermidine/putrescine transport system substrate-binding protein [Roseomonas pecuniae]
MIRMNRRALLGASLGALAMPALPRTTMAAGSMSAAVYPGGWDEALRGVLAPALKRAHDVDVAFEPLFAVDQIAKARAARGVAPFDVFVLDPGPRVQGIDLNLFESFDPSRLANRAKLPEGYADRHGAGVAAQVVGIAYNPKKLPKPAGWRDLFKPEYASRLGLTGFGTTFGTVSLIEMAKVWGGSETDVEPLFTELRKILPQVAAVAQPAAIPGLFQQGQIDVMYTNTYTVSLLKSRGVVIEFALPETGGVAFGTTMHIAKGAKNIEQSYQYIDTMIATDVQSALSQAPYFFVPVNTEVTPGAEVPMRSIADLSKFVTHDWSKINPLRPRWIDRFNREMAK